MDKKYIYEYEDGGKWQILKPTRRQREAADLYYARQVNKMVENGIMPLSAWIAKVNGNNGSTSDQKRELIGSVVLEYREVKEKIDQLNVKENRSDQENSELSNLNDKLTILESEFQAYQTVDNQSLDHTAEGMARTRLITWLFANLSYKNDEPLFKGETLDQKLDYLETLEDQDILKNSALLEAIIRAWYLKGSPTDKEFWDEIDKVVKESLVKEDVAPQPIEPAAPDPAHEE